MSWESVIQGRMVGVGSYSGTQHGEGGKEHRGEGERKSKKWFGEPRGRLLLEEWERGRTCRGEGACCGHGR